MLVWLSVCSEVQTCIWSSWRHCHSLSLASVKSRLVLPFWCRLTRIVPDKGPLNMHVCVCCGCLSVLNSRINILQFACGITSHQAVLYADCGSGCDTSQRSSLLLLRCWSGITGKPFLRCSTNGSMTCLHLTDQQTLLPVDRHNRFSVHFKWIP